MERRRVSIDGPLCPMDAHGLMLPPGFTSRVVARSGTQIADYLWHSAPGAGACFADGSGWIYVSNSDVPLVGGVGAIRFDAAGSVVDAYATLSGTDVNRAGGATPWHTWLTCEKTDDGQVWETDPWGIDAAVARPAMGRFSHQACAVDPDRRVVYLTEDQPDGGFYRFTPTGWPDLSAGLLEVLAGEPHGWTPVPDPAAACTPTRHQIAHTTPFNGGRGTHCAAGTCWFTTAGDNHVWAYDTDTGTVRQHDTVPPHDTVTRSIGGLHEICLVTPDGVVAPFVRVIGHERSGIAGPAFSPDGTRLYFSSPRGTAGSPAAGMTFEVSGPIRR